MKRLIIRLCSLLCACTSVAPLQADTFKWLITPDQYDGIEFYGDGIYKYNKNGRVGLMENTGSKILESECDSITPCVNNVFSLLLDNIGEQEATLIGVFNSKSHKVIIIEKGRYNVKMDYAFFSDNRLPVKNHNGRWGYLGIDGNIAIPCEFIKALPFYINRAPVEVKKNEWKYIKPNGDLAFTMEFIISSATPFFNDSTAYVAFDGNRKAAHINSRGQKLGKNIDREEYIKRAKEWLYNYRSFQEKAISQLTRSDKPEVFSVVERSQLEVLQIQKDQAVVRTKEGKQGILQLVQGDFILREPTITTSLVKRKKQKMISMQLDIPDGLLWTDLTFEIDKGDGQLCEVEAGDYQLSSDKRTIIFEFEPSTKSNSKDVTLRFAVKNYGFTIFDVNNTQIHINNPDPPNTCKYCGEEHNWKHKQCRICGLFTDKVRSEFKCEGNGNHVQCKYPKCNKYKFTKCGKGYEKNRCPQSIGKRHPRPS